MYVEVLKVYCLIRHNFWSVNQVLEKTYMNDRHLIEDVFSWFYFVDRHFRFSSEGFKQIKVLIG